MPHLPGSTALKGLILEDLSVSQRMVRSLHDHDDQPRRRTPDPHCSALRQYGLDLTVVELGSLRAIRRRMLESLAQRLNSSLQRTPAPISTGGKVIEFPSGANRGNGDYTQLN